MCHAAAVTVAAVLGSPARCNPLWFYLFAADKLQHTSTSNLDVSHHHFSIDFVLQSFRCLLLTHRCRLLDKMKYKETVVTGGTF